MVYNFVILVVPTKPRAEAKISNYGPEISRYIRRSGLKLWGFGSVETNDERSVRLICAVVIYLFFWDSQLKYDCV